MLIYADMSSNCFTSVFCTFPSFVEKELSKCERGEVCFFAYITWDKLHVAYISSQWDEFFEAELLEWLPRDSNWSLIYKNIKGKKMITNPDWGTNWPCAWQHEKEFYFEFSNLKIYVGVHTHACRCILHGDQSFCSYCHRLLPFSFPFLNNYFDSEGVFLENGSQIVN